MPLLHKKRFQKKSSEGAVKKLKSFQKIYRKTTVSAPPLNGVSGVQRAILPKTDIDTSVLL